ncbi:hypothetical protein C7T94_12305 [Pedobacter yulinensis]|uniref:Uncharacterized protein n=1 Tax=Pedobacter yulinensis TaxID=2126353 RepID=A0A2T3HLR7_9SPHI|nr:hypothetical protein C7T94_12305 [Pedobacter yulinensis]
MPASTEQHENRMFNHKQSGRLYTEVSANWNLELAGELLSPGFTSHDWPAGTPTGPKFSWHSMNRSAGPCRMPVMKWMTW